MSAYSAIAAAFRYADKESHLLRQAIKIKEGKAGGVPAASSEKHGADVKTKAERTKRK